MIQIHQRSLTDESWMMMEICPVSRLGGEEGIEPTANTKSSTDGGLDGVTPWGLCFVNSPQCSVTFILDLSQKSSA